jgi:hypothetical protein
MQQQKQTTAGTYALWFVRGAWYAVSQDDDTVVESSDPPPVDPPCPN